MFPTRNGTRNIHSLTLSFCNEMQELSNRQIMSHAYHNYELTQFIRHTYVTVVLINCKQTGVKIRSHICGTWSWLQPVCLQHYIFSKYPSGNLLLVTVPRRYPYIHLYFIMSWVYFNEFMYDWWHSCVSVLCLRGGCMFCAAFGISFSYLSNPTEISFLST